MKKMKVAVIGATGMVGQRLVSLLEDHPLFTVSAVLASPNSAGKPYEEAICRRAVESPPPSVRGMQVLDAVKDAEKAAECADLAFCALSLPPDETRALEEKYARLELPVISNNSAHRETPDVPMVIPELNPEHLEVIPYQKKRLRTRRGFLVVKSNCSLQSYLPFLHPLKRFGIKQVAVCTCQAVSGAGKTLWNMPEISDNILPYIPGEEEKSEREPLKIWGNVEKGVISPANSPPITAQCLRVPVSDGHLAATFVSFEKKPTEEEILSAWRSFEGEPQRLGLFSAPKRFLHYFEEPDRPQPKLDRDLENGMAVSAGRLRKDKVFDFRFIGLSHNLLRGAAGGAILLAELLAAKGFLG